MTRKAKSVIALAVTLAVLAACDESDGTGGGIASLGAVFQTAFGQGPNDTPVDVSNANLMVDPTGEPFEL